MAINDDLARAAWGRVRVARARRCPHAACRRLRLCRGLGPCHTTTGEELTDTEERGAMLALKARIGREIEKRIAEGRMPGVESRQQSLS